MCADNSQDHHYRVLAFHTEYHRLYIGQDTNILNDNTGSDANFQLHSVMSSGSNSHTHLLSPLLPPYLNTRNTDPVSN